MAVGKGSMDRASKAAKNKEAKNSKINAVEKMNCEEENTEEKQSRKKAEIMEQTQKVSAQKVKTGTTRKTVVTIKNKEKNSSDQGIKIKRTEEKEASEQNLNPICSIGDEMPIYFL